MSRPVLCCPRKGETTRFHGYCCLQAVARLAVTRGALATQQFLSRLTGVFRGEPGFWHDPPPASAKYPRHALYPTSLVAIHVLFTSSSGDQQDGSALR